MSVVKNIRAWRPAQAELAQPRRLPDGLLEVCLEGETKEEPFVLEVTTYPERRVSQQMTDDLLLVYLDRGQSPEGIWPRSATRWSKTSRSPCLRKKSGSSGGGARDRILRGALHSSWIRL